MNFWMRHLTLETFEQLLGYGEGISCRLVLAGGFDLLRQFNDRRPQLFVFRIDFNAIGRIERRNEQVTWDARVAQWRGRAQNHQVIIPTSITVRRPGLLLPMQPAAYGQRLELCQETPQAISGSRITSHLDLRSNCMRPRRGD